MCGGVGKGLKGGLESDYKGKSREFKMQSRLRKDRQLGFHGILGGLRPVERGLERQFKALAQGLSLDFRLGQKKRVSRRSGSGLRRVPGLHG